MAVRLTLYALFAVVWAAPAAASQRTPPVESDQEILIRLERGWNDAFYKRDVKFIESILADEFVATYDDGSRGDKARELALAAGFNQQVESAVQEDFVVKVYRDAAVVWFTLEIVGMRQGQRVPLTFSYTDVWVFRDGRWLCVSTHSTRIANR